MEDESALARLDVALSKFAANSLAPYVQRLRSNGRVPQRKELNDPVWGTLTLTPLEVLVLDSPILQRLRTIRQLGVAHWVFPGALHTRLEHSLGALHQVERLVRSINESSHEDAVSIPDDLRRLLRMAALCHDVGHGFMSHVSEKALDESPEVEDVTLDFVDRYHVERPQFSEISSFLIIGSEAFGELIRVAQDISRDQLPDQAVDKLQRAVTGQSIDDRFPLIHELISGPFDADKLDYMTRDAQMCGVPVVTDIPRLVQKVRAVSRNDQNLPIDLKRHLEPSDSTRIITGIALSGARTLDELMLGRSLLFDKIYRHQKVRAVESMIRVLVRGLTAIAATGNVPASMVPFLASDDIVAGNLTRNRIADILPESDLSTTSDAVDLVEDLSKRLGRRELFERALVVSSAAMPGDPYRDDERQRAGLIEFGQTAADSTKARDFERKVAEEIRRIAEILDEDIPFGASLQSYVALDGAGPHRDESSEIERAYLISRGGRITRFRDESADSRGWSNAYLLTRDLTYVFVPPEISEIATIASESVLRRDFGVTVPESMKEYRGSVGAEDDSTRERLAERGYYDALPSDVRPLHPRLRKLDVEERTASVVSRLSAFHGTAPPGDRGKYTLHQRRVVDWLAQFREEDLIESALSVLERIELVGRAEASEALDEFLAEQYPTDAGWVCPLGTAGDSGSVISYFARDALQERAGWRIGTVEEALAVDDTPIVFIDDFAWTGRQTGSIFAHWLGAADKDDELNEQRDALSAESQARLREREIAIVFSAAREEGRLYVETRLSNLGVTNVKGVWARVDAENLPTIHDAEIIPDASTRDRFIEYCREVGQSLIGDDPRASQRALGYGNHGLLAVFHYNIPTQSLTCLWREGTEGDTWMPLLPRRKKH